MFSSEHLGAISVDRADARPDDGGDGPGVHALLGEVGDDHAALVASQSCEARAMATFLTLLYVLAAGLSVWGVIGPFIAAKRHQSKAERARACRRELERQKYTELDSEDEAVRNTAHDRFNAAISEPFEGGSETLDRLSSSWVIKGGSTASTARDNAQNRAAGLPWVVAGVVVGSLASALSIWLLP